jgi:hypothetical protein
MSIVFECPLSGLKASGFLEIPPLVFHKIIRKQTSLSMHLSIQIIAFATVAFSDVNAAPVSPVTATEGMLSVLLTLSS